MERPFFYRMNTDKGWIRADGVALTVRVMERPGRSILSPAGEEGTAEGAERGRHRRRITMASTALTIKVLIGVHLCASL
jgi:hypothetical protein